MAVTNDFNKKVQAKVDAANGGANAMAKANVNNTQSNIGNIFNNINAQQQAAAKNISEGYAKSNLKSTEEYVKAVNDSYNEGIELQKKQTANNQAALNQQYQYNIDQNAVQAAVNRRQIQQTLSDYGIKNSGQQAVQQTANEVAKQNGANAITMQKNAAYNNLAAQLDEYIANANMNRAQNTAVAYKSMADNNAAADLSLAQGAMNNASSMAGTQYSTENQNEQNALDRAHQTSEREAQQSWQRGENQKDRDFTRSERLDTQKYNTSEREATQKYNTSERVAQQNWQSGENAKDRAATLVKSASSGSSASGAKSSSGLTASQYNSAYSKYNDKITEATSTKEKCSQLAAAVSAGLTDSDIDKLRKAGGLSVTQYQAYMSGADPDKVTSTIAAADKMYKYDGVSKKSFVVDKYNAGQISVEDYDYIMAHYGF